MQTQHTITNTSFSKWVFGSREARLMLVAGLALGLLQYWWIKSSFPLPNFLPDSYSYIKAAYNNEFINSWPIGYSKFLRFISVISQSHAFLTLVQFLILLASVLYFILSIRFLLKPGKWATIIIFLALVLCPLLGYVANLVSSDCLFTALSIVWFTQLLWILKQPGKRLFILHGIVLLLAFTVRYNALIYPFFSVLIIFFSQAGKRLRYSTIGAIAVSLLAFVGITQYEYGKVTGSVQFSPFSGWQMASNALYTYANVPHAERKPVPGKFEILHKRVNHHMDSLEKLLFRPDQVLGVYYMWNEKAPLIAHMKEWYASNDTSGKEFARWTKISPFYYEYGRTIIKQYPLTYANYFLLQNLVSYYVPKTEFLGTYNMGKDTIDDLERRWFGLESNSTRYHGKKYEIPAVAFYQIFSGTLNFLFVVGLLGFIILNGFASLERFEKRVFQVTLLIWVCNLAFSVLVSPIVLRYQLFPLIITTTWCILFIAYVVQKSFVNVKYRYHESADLKDIQVHPASS